MTTIDVETVRWRLPRRLTNARSTHVEREAVRCVVEDGAGRVVAEAAPLEGFGQDDLAAARSALERLVAGDLHAMECSESLLDRLRAAAQWCPDSASARFALECVLLRRAADSVVDGVRVCAAELGFEAVSTIDAAGWASDLEDARRLRDEGFRTIKYKLGVETASADQETLRTLGALDCAVRADANGSAVDDATWRVLSEVGAEFVEEPGPEAALQDWRRSKVPVALDESLADAGAAEVAACVRRGVQVVVLKPMVLGLLGSLERAKTVRAAGARVVVSHLLDGDLAWSAHAGLALALGGSLALGAQRGALAHGLGRRPTLDAAFARSVEHRASATTGGPA